MAVIKPFRGLRPQRELVQQVAAPPYDVLSSAEARIQAEGNPYSFLHVNKPEIDLPEDISPYDKQVYQKGAANLQNLIQQGILQQDAEPKLYIYKQIMGQHEQIGLVVAASVEAYEQGLIKKHEFTRPVKEDDRVNHVHYLNAQVGPVFLTYKANDEIDSLIAKSIDCEPEYNFVSDGIRHIFWLVSAADTINDLEQSFISVEALYVADGHHRSAAAMRVKQKRQAENPQHTGDEPYNFFLAVIFPHNQMQILDYNRVVKDLNGFSRDGLMAEIETQFLVNEVSADQLRKPASEHCFAMYLQGQWYQLVAQKNTFDNSDPVKKLDVSILQENILAPLLGVGDPRTDKRIDFVGGIRGLSELKARVDSGDWAVAFALYPTSIENLMAIADAGEVMPPKSTWFEPKLKTGLVIHQLD